MSLKKSRVLFLDDDRTFLETVKALMACYAGENWEILTASSTPDALQIIQEQHLDLLVIDVHMPVVDGLQFLSLLQRKFPSLLKVVLTGDARETYRATCLSNGAELFLQKPATAQGWQSIYTTLNALVGFAPEEGFRGVLRRVSLEDVLQMECLARHSLILEVSTQSTQGFIVLKEGDIVHAEAGGRLGQEAFNYLMSLKGGEFSLKPFVEPETRTITDSWEFLLMEAARKRDETREPGKEPAGDVASEQTSDTPTPSLPQQVFKPQIEEVLICSAQGDVLYDWQCRDVNARLSFLEFLSRKAKQLAQGLPLGEFERLEAEEPGERVVAQIQSDRAMLVRTSKSPDVAG